MITSAFTCTGPYAILIMLGIKRVENRNVLPTPSKGRCAVSCSKSFNAAEYGNFIQWASTHLPPEDFERIPAWADVKDWPGKIIGCCDYSARQASTPYDGVSREPWDEGCGWWWDLNEVVCFDNPIPCRGNVGMWQMPEVLSREVDVVDTRERHVGACVRTPEDAAKLFRDFLPMVGSSEGFFVLPLDEIGHVKSLPVLVSLGTDPATTTVRLNDVFAVVLKFEAEAFIVAHNHPRGTLIPSPEDIQLTRTIKATADVLEIKFLDHLILGRSGDFAGILNR